jgi:SAM-dependent methyltransferase
MLQFAPDKVAVLREFWRLLRPGGRAVIATFLGSEFHPFHRPLDEILARLLGEPAFAIGFSFGDPALLRGAIEAAGLTAESFDRVTIESRFPAEHASLRGFVLSATAGIPSFRTLDGAGAIAGNARARGGIPRGRFHARQRTGRAVDDDDRDSG